MPGLRFNQGWTALHGLKPDGPAAKVHCCGLPSDDANSLFVFSNDRQDHWHFVNVKFGEDPQKRRLFRRITVGPLERLRTASERVAMLDLASLGRDLFGLPPLAVQQRHDEAFDVGQSQSCSSQTTRPSSTPCGMT